jgi:hypothetical protein
MQGLPQILSLIDFLIKKKLHLVQTHIHTENPLVFAYVCKVHNIYKKNVKFENS